MNSRRLSAWQCVIIVRQNCETSAAWDLKMDSSLKNKTIKKKQKFMNINPNKLTESCYTKIFLDAKYLLYVTDRY